MMNTHTQIKTYLKTVWPPKYKNQSIDFKSLINILSTLGYKPKSIKNDYILIDSDGSGHITFSKVISYLYKIQHRAEIKILYDLIRKKDSKIGTVRFHAFLNKIQEQNISLKQAQNIIKNYNNRHHVDDNTDDPSIDYDTFELFIMGSLSEISKKEILDDTQSLSNYYISSSHNTYLEKHQLVGKSSVNAYINVLKNGCKCVEIDCWDYKGAPMVYHGYTLTTKIPLSDVIRVILKYSFHTSPYPVIVTIENHCSREMEAKMAEYFVNILGEVLLLPNKTSVKVLPNLKELKNKIILRGKINDKTHPNLAKLIYIKNTRIVKTNYNALMSVSYDEDVIGLIDTAQKEIIKCYTHTNLVRVYPHGTRFDSSNYSPIKSWSDGCQLVALNWQYLKINMRLNVSFFGLNKNCGYRLKPIYLRDKVSEPNKTMNLNIKILSGRFLFGHNLKLKAAVIGYSGDVVTHKSQKVKNNGLMPIWDYAFKFRLLRPHRDFIMFELHDNDKLTAYYCLKVDDIQVGYRNIPLKWIKYKDIKANLFTKIDIE